LIPGDVVEVIVQPERARQRIALERWEVTYVCTEEVPDGKDTIKKRRPTGAFTTPTILLVQGQSVELQVSDGTTPRSLANAAAAQKFEVIKPGELTFKGIVKLQAEPPPKPCPNAEVLPTQPFRRTWVMPNGSAIYPVTVTIHRRDKP
jgi:hypothetical protein